MTKKVLSCALTGLMLSFVSSCRTDPSTFNIKGTIEGLPDGSVVELIPAATHKNEKGMSSDTITAHAFEFTGHAEEPRLFRIVVSGEHVSGSIPVMVEASDISITAKASHQEEGKYTHYQFTGVTVKGSKAHSEYIKKSIEPRAAMNKLYEEYHIKNREILDKVSDARKVNDQDLLQMLYATDAWKALEKNEKHFFETVSANIEKMVLDNAATWWSTFLMMDQLSYFGEEQKAWWEKLSDEARDSYYGRLVKEELFPVELIGEKVPEFTISDHISLKTLMKDKKYTLIDFWASWCAPCLKEIPNLKEVYKLYASKGLEIISISTDKSESEWMEALEKEALPWPNFRDKSDIANAYSVKMIPSTFLVNEKGIVIEKNLRGQALLEKLASLFP